MKTRGFRAHSPKAAERAKVALRALVALQKRRGVAVEVRPGGRDGEDSAVALPPEAVDLLREILGQMAEGNSVQVVAVQGELTTQQVADLLNVSRPHVVQLLEQRKIPSRKVGAHRRVRAEDAMAYRAEDERRREKVLRELTAEAQKHGLGY